MVLFGGQGVVRVFGSHILKKKIRFCFLISPIYISFNAMHILDVSNLHISNLVMTRFKLAPITSPDMILSIALLAWTRTSINRKAHIVDLRKG